MAHHGYEDGAIVYAIRFYDINTGQTKFYIGETFNGKARWAEHKFGIVNHCHHTSELRDIYQPGVLTSFHVLQHTKHDKHFREEDKLQKLERYYWEYVQSQPGIEALNDDPYEVSDAHDQDNASENITLSTYEPTKEAKEILVPFVTEQTDPELIAQEFYATGKSIDEINISDGRDEIIEKMRAHSQPTPVVESAPVAEKSNYVPTAPVSATPTSSKRRYRPSFGGGSRLKGCLVSAIIGLVILFGLGIWLLRSCNRPPEAWENQDPAAVSTETMAPGVEEEIEIDIEDGPGVPYDEAVTTEDLNIRAMPSCDGEVLGEIPAGTTVVVTGESSDGWYPVAYEDTEGWSSGHYLDGPTITDGRPLC